MDLWGFGCLFYEMLALKPLFPGKDELDQINKITKSIGLPPKDLVKKFNK